MRRQHIFLTALLSASMGLMSACMDMSEPTSFNQERIVVEQDTFSRTMKTSAFDESYAYDIWNHYRRYGNSPVHLTVAYNPNNQNNASMDASVELARITAMLRKEGVRDISGDIMPVQDRDVPHARVLISYKTAHARGPDCEHQLPGLESNNPYPNSDYKIGCSMDGLLAKQVSRSADLMGREELDPADSRRQSAIIDRYRSGEQNDDLSGESLSEE